MSANKQRQALAQAKARAKSRRRRFGREKWPHMGRRNDGDIDPVVYAVGNSENDIEYLGPAPGVDKMSAVLLEFIEPFQSATPRRSGAARRRSRRSTRTSGAVSFPR